MHLPRIAPVKLSLIALALGAAAHAADPASPGGDPVRGKALFQQSCALCHAVVLGPGNTAVSGQGPNLVGVVGRRAASLAGFNFSKAMAASGITWDAASLERFLAAPTAAVPGTTMPAAVPNATDRADVIAYLSTLVAPQGVSPAAGAEPAPARPYAADPGDWRNDGPGVKHRVVVADLPAPFATASAGNGPETVKRPDGAVLSVPPGFTISLFAQGLNGPRLMRTAPNNDIFIAETRADRIRVMRADDGAGAPSINEVFADGLNAPFGIAFYPAGADPQWIYVANNNSVVRFPYRNGDLHARGAAEVLVPKLCDGSSGGHTTRGVAFSRDGLRMFISVGSGSNVAEDDKRKSAADIRLWEAAHGRGAAWGSETNRADILVTDPLGREPLKTFATGIRNGVGLSVDPATGELWVATNERDALGDDLVPDYLTHVKEGGYYGWPWYYMGNHEDPRHAGERPDLAGQTIVPDVPVQSHSAALEFAFYYPAEGGVAAFPAEYRGDIFAAFHGSWNRSSRTGYKVVRVRRHDGVATGEYDDFVTGFVVDNKSVWGRPVGVAVAHDGALLVSEDGNGTLWRISYSGAAAQAGAAPAGRKAVLTADDLPRHTYKVSEAPSLILTDDKAFAALEEEVRRDVDADLLDYDIKDQTALKGYKSTQLSLALLDGDNAAGERLIGELRALEEKPGLRLTTGIVAEALIRARNASTGPEGIAKAFQLNLSDTVQQLPWDAVQNEIKQTKAGFEVRSPALLVGICQQEIDPAALKTGEISATVARQLVGMRNQLVNYLPYKAQIVAALDAVVAAHVVVKPDRWTPRLVSLAPDAKAVPVRVGIWDSGVDVDVFKHRLATDAEGRHGIAFDLHADPVPDLIYPLGEAQAHLAENIARVKGFIDLQASVDSPESADLKRYMSGLKPDQVKPTLESLGMTDNWAHGTHVTGIAFAGNPFARLIVGRITFDYHLVPETPTMEQARKDAVAYKATVDYFLKNGVRVVNMSWGGSLKDVEQALEANGAGGTAEERKKLARQIFDVDTAGLLEALKQAPGILFVVAAGNGDNNVKFDEFVPSSFQLPNMITVGAVDQAGEETSFSSFGPMVNVHADGFEVESFIPGGQRLKFSGTSMASPQVTNLAAKLFALDPALTPEDAKALIMAGCDRNGRVNLVSPAKSVELLRKKLEGGG
jgi:glucose/arabinose dehydrogenase